MFVLYEEGAMFPVNRRSDSLRQPTTVFAIMTVYTEVLRVGTVGGIILRVPVLMVDCKEAFAF